MNQVADIIALAARAREQGIDAVLATVVRTEGSAYRRTGAMMLICDDGQSVGMISGGCLEPHIIKRAFWLTRRGACVQVYQTGDDQTDDNTGESEDISEDELNFGMGCNGRVHILFERLSEAWPFLQTLIHVRKSQRPEWIATVIKSDHGQYPTGYRINLTQQAALMPTSDFDSLKSQKDITPIIQELLSQHSKEAWANKSAYHIHMTTDDQGRDCHWLIQEIQPQLRLLICGAGNDVVPLVALAKMQDWHVTVIDSRAHYATRVRFMQADEVLCLPLEDSDTLLKLSHNAAVAVMSHSLSQDRARLAVLLQHPPPYLGQLGPCYRTQRLIDEIGAMIEPARLQAGVDQLYYPIGYKLGGDGPEALALGIIAQISAVMHQWHLCRHNAPEPIADPAYDG